MARCLTHGEVGKVMELQGLPIENDDNDDACLPVCRVAATESKVVD